jgi:hypothetical protein
VKGERCMNSCRSLLRKFARSVFALALLAGAAGVAAQGIHKEIDAAGRVTYSDQPDTTPTWHLATVPALDVANALARNAAISSRFAATVDADEAARRLGQALLDRQLGAERLPGERVHGADASAANQRYRVRQQDLQREVEQALRRAGVTSRSLRERP